MAHVEHQTEANTVDSYCAEAKRIAKSDAIFDTVVFRRFDAYEDTEIRKIFEKYDHAQRRATARGCMLLSEKILPILS